MEVESRRLEIRRLRNRIDNIIYSIRKHNKEIERMKTERQSLEKEIKELADYKEA